MNKVIEMLQSKYDIHCAILYGSRTTQTYFPDSDYDILAIRKSGDRVREVLNYENKVIDLIVETEELINSPENYIFLWSYKILLDKNGFGEKLIEQHQAYLKQPALKLPLNRAIQRKKQIKDELKYIKLGGVIGDYRRHDLLAKILPLYFNLIGEWYLGDKHALNWLQINNPNLYSLFVAAFHPNATIKEFELLIENISKTTD